MIHHRVLRNRLPAGQWHAHGNVRGPGCVLHGLEFGFERIELGVDFGDTFGVALTRGLRALPCDALDFGLQRGAVLAALGAAACAPSQNGESRVRVRGQMDSGVEYGGRF